MRWFLEKILPDKAFNFPRPFQCVDSESDPVFKWHFDNRRFGRLVMVRAIDYLADGENTVLGYMFECREPTAIEIMQWGAELDKAEVVVESVKTESELH